MTRYHLLGRKANLREMSLDQILLRKVFHYVRIWFSYAYNCIAVGESSKLSVMARGVILKSVMARVPSGVLVSQDAEMYHEGKQHRGGRTSPV
jgi:hypothetical protein